MNVYVVIKTGVYRHDIIGVYRSIDDGIEAGRIAASLESDDYHDFEVFRCELGHPGEEQVAIVDRVDVTHWDKNRQRVLDSTELKVSRISAFTNEVVAAASAPDAQK